MRQRPSVNKDVRRRASHLVTLLQYLMTRMRKQQAAGMCPGQHSQPKGCKNTNYKTNTNNNFRSQYSSCCCQQRGNINPKKNKVEKAEHLSQKVFFLNVFGLLPFLHHVSEGNIVLSLHLCDSWIGDKSECAIVTHATQRTGVTAVTHNSSQVFLFCLSFFSFFLFHMQSCPGVEGHADHSSIDHCTTVIYE